MRLAARGESVVLGLSVFDTMVAGAAPVGPVALWTLVDNRASSKSAVLCSKLGAAGQTAGGQGVDRDAEGQDGEDLRELHVGRI